MGLTGGVDGTFRPTSASLLIAAIHRLLHNVGIPAILSLGSGCGGFEGPLAESGVPVLGMELCPLRLMKAALSILEAEDKQTITPASFVVAHGDLCKLQPNHFLRVIPGAQWVIYCDSEGMPQECLDAMTTLAGECIGKVLAIVCSHKHLERRAAMPPGSALVYQEKLNGLQRSGSGQKTSMYVYKVVAASERHPSSEFESSLPADANEDYFKAAVGRVADTVWSSTYNQNLVRELNQLIPNGTRRSMVVCARNRAAEAQEELLRELDAATADLVL